MKIFFAKVKHFFKRNIYPITVSLCTILVLSVITVSAYTSIKNSNNSIETGNQNDIEQPVDNVNDNKTPDDNKKPQEGSNDNNNDNKNPNDETKPTDTSNPIIFDLPYENAEIQKAYAEFNLLYDATTNFYCTHQAIDFLAKDGVIACAVFDGKITKVESTMMFGTVVYLQISDELTVCYKGLGNDIYVKEGDVVKKGQKLGKITGMLAENADGIHLHLELLKGGELIDPTQYFSFTK